MGKLGGVEHRLVSEADRTKLQQVVAKLLGPQLAQVGWDAKPDEPDDSRLRRAAVIRALGAIARDPGVLGEARARLDRFLAGDTAAIENNLQDAVVGMVARGGDAARFEALLKKFHDERDPAFKRRYLMSLTAFEDPALAKRALGLLMGEVVPLQDLASFASGLLANRTARAEAFSLITSRWDEIAKKAGGAPMLMRRIVEAMGNLVERSHVEAAEKFLAAHTSDVIKQAVLQTQERMKQDLELRERALPAVSAWLKAP